MRTVPFVERSRNGPARPSPSGYPMRIRPGGSGSGTGVKAIAVDVSVDCESEDSSPVTAWGTPVKVTGLPDFSALTGLVHLGTSPVSCQSSMDDSGTAIGVSLNGGSIVGAVLYKDGNKFDWTGGGSYYKQIGSSSHQGRWLNYGYYAGRYNAGMDATNLIRGDGVTLSSCPVQAWGDPPYVPTHVGLVAICTNCKVSRLTRLMFLWLP